MNPEEMDTEEGFPIRTIYIPNISINITNQMLRDYFRQFGAIERVQIVPERLKIFSNLPTISTAGTGLVDHLSNQFKYYSYVTFVNAIGAVKALSKQKHLVWGHQIEVDKAFSWNQSACDLNKYLSENQQPTSTQKETLYRQIDKGLNDDCIRKIMTYLNIFELAAMAKFSPRFQAIAQQIRTLHIDTQTSGKIVTLMELRSILRLLGFGHSVISLSVSMKSFNLSAQHYICDRLFHYIGPQLRSLTLTSFAITTEQFELMKPLLLQLNYLDIDFNYEFDYKKFNFAWPNLKTFHTRTSDFVKAFVSEGDEGPEFSVLTKMMLASVHRLPENLFNRLHRACAKITDLVIINNDAYPSESNPLVRRTTDLANLCAFTELTRLHLSLSLSYFNETIIDVISQLTKLKHFTLEITNAQQTDDRAFPELNRNLRKIGTSLPNIKDIHFSSIPLEENKVAEMLKYAPILDSLRINQCNFKLSARFIRNIVTSRKEYFNTAFGQRTPIPLEIIVNEFPDSVVMNLLQEPETMQYLKVPCIINKTSIKKYHQIYQNELLLSLGE